MDMEIERYRLLRLAQDEICVAAAFLDIAGLYGISDRWIRKGDGLAARVSNIVAALEQKGLMLAEPGGTVWMEPGLYDVLGCMGKADRVGRLGFPGEGGARWLYLYRDGERAAFLEHEGRGTCFLGFLPSREAMESIWTGSCAEEWGKGERAWLGALVFGRFGGCYEPLLDLAWTGEEQAGKAQEPGRSEANHRDLAGQESFEKAWSSVCRAFWEEPRGEEGSL